MTPKISVVLPTYNRASWLPTAINSVLNQTRRDWELAVVDDGSTDVTRDVLSRYTDPRIKVLHLDHVGQNAAIRTGVEAITAPLVTFLADDDELPHVTLEVYTDAMIDPAVDVAYGDAIVEFCDTIFNGAEGEVRREYAVDPDYLPKRNVVWGAAFRRSMYDAMGGWPTQWSIVSDYAFWLTAYASGFRFRRIPAVTYWYRIHANGQTHVHWDVNRAEVPVLQRMFEAGALDLRQRADWGRVPA